MKMHPSITLHRVAGAIERSQTTGDHPGICIACGADAEDVEPDARRAPCEACGQPVVFGAEQLLISLL